MKPQDLIIRCYAEQKDGAWQAFCLNFDLAVQGKSSEEVHDKLVAMIQDYVYDALAEDGVDRDYAAQLLTRKAPLSNWLRYYLIACLCKFNNFKKDLCRITAFNTVLPLGPHRHA